MAGRTRIFVALFTVSLLSFTLLDFLQIGWFTQWDGGPAPYIQQIIFFIAIILCRTTVAEITSIKLLGVTPNVKSVVYSLLVYGPPLLVVQLSLGIHFFLVYVPVSLERTFVGAVISWLELAILLDFSRLFLVYFITLRLR